MYQDNVWFHKDQIARADDLANREGGASATAVNKNSPAGNSLKDKIKDKGLIGGLFDFGKELLKDRLLMKMMGGAGTAATGGGILTTGLGGLAGTAGAGALGATAMVAAIGALATAGVFMGVAYAAGKWFETTDMFKAMQEDSKKRQKENDDKIQKDRDALAANPDKVKKDNEILDKKGFFNEIGNVFSSAYWEARKTNVQEVNAGKTKSGEKRDDSQDAAFAGWYAKGGAFKVDSPTVFGAGENGPEDVFIVPKGGGVPPMGGSSSAGSAPSGQTALAKNTAALKENTKITGKETELQKNALEEKEKDDGKGDIPGLPDLPPDSSGWLGTLKNMVNPTPSGGGGRGGGGNRPSGGGRGGGGETANQSSATGGVAGGNYEKYLGYSYQYGADGSNGKSIDCSALTQKIAKDSGVNIPRTAQGQFDAMTGGQPVGRSQLQPGDLVFFADPTVASNGRNISHTGVYLGKDAQGNEKMLHSGKGGSKVVDFNSSYYQKYFAGGARAAGGGGEKIAANLGYGSKAVPAGTGGGGGSSVAGNTAQSVGGKGSDVMMGKEDGSTETRSGGTPAWRNNNPGNLRFTNQEGAVGKDASGFAIFKSLEAGETARKKLLFGEGSIYANMSIMDMAKKYAPKGDGNNDPVSYANQIASGLGISTDTKISQLNPDQQQRLLEIMKKREGFVAGNVTSTPAATSNMAQTKGNIDMAATPTVQGGLGGALSSMAKSAKNWISPTAGNGINTYNSNIQNGGAEIQQAKADSRNNTNNQSKVANVNNTVVNNTSGGQAPSKGGATTVTSGDRSWISMLTKGYLS
jgi:cell wall-associated NlpC family hydrolase